VGRTGDRKGWLELSTGTVTYYRASAQTRTLSLTYQQLIAVLEQHIEYTNLDPNAFKLPRRHPDGDFVISVSEFDDGEPVGCLVESRTDLRKLDPRRIDLGSYQFSQDMQSGRKPKNITWFARLSIQAALWVVHVYVEKFLCKGSSGHHVDADVQISRAEMKAILLALHKRIA
jgi:hypothetical protein